MTRGTTSRSATNPSISLDDVMPHLQTTIFITGAFCIAWSWDLVAFGFSHAWAGDNPMREQIGFGNQRAPKVIYVLLLQYLLVTACAAYLSYTIQQRFGHERWCPAAIMAVEFVPSPFFSGKLMAYLGQFTGLSSLEQVGYNLLATAFAAFLAHSVQGSYMVILPVITRTETSITATLPTSDSTTTIQPTLVKNLLPRQLDRFPLILSETLGFGLGVAWNVFLVQLLAPQEMDYRHIIGLFGYLMVVLMIAFRLAAMVEEGQPSSNDTSNSGDAGPSLMQRMLSMLSFAANVVCAFTMVAFIHAMLAPGWLGDFLCLSVLILLATIMSAMVALVVDTTASDNHSAAAAAAAPRQRRSWRRQRQPQQPQQGYIVHAEGDEEAPKVGFGTCFAMDALIFIPCVWCCCPWIPLIWILAGMTPNVTVKDKWQKLIAFVLGLATSIQASGMLTTLTNVIAVELNICNEKYCRHEWIFVALQVLLAMITTSVLLAALVHVNSTPFSSQQQAPHPGTSASSSSGQDERQPLLGRVSKLVSKFSNSSSSSKS